MLAEKGKKSFYWLMVILMLLILGSLALSALTFIVILLTGNSGAILAMDNDGEQHGHPLTRWILVVSSIIIFTFFSLGYILPLGHRDWRSAGATQAFIIALFTEMFGVPLTIYIVSGLLGGIFTLGKGDHLLARTVASIIDLDTWNAIASVMALSLIILIVALFSVFLGWKEIYNGKGQLVTSGIYRHIRHPQYTGILLFILAWLIQWPTIITIILAPILVFTYYRLARREEKELEQRFGSEYTSYKQKVPMFIPLSFHHRGKG